MELTGIDRLKQARSRLMISNVFFGSAAISLKFVEDRTQPTAWTDGKTLGFNPDFTDSLPMDQLETLICHEVLHAILNHPLRLKGKDHATANKAMDYTVNGITQRANLAAIPELLFDDLLSSKERSFEQNYATLQQQKREEEEKQKQDQQNQPQEQKPEENPGPNTGQPGQDQEGEDQQPGEQAGDVREPKAEDGKPLDESEAAQQEAQWKVIATQAAQKAQQAGQGSAELTRLIETLTVKQRDLEDVLRDFLSAAITSDYSYRRPNKKHIIHDLYMPSLDGEEIAKIVMVMDTSGSVGETELSYFTAKLNNILAEYKTTVQVIYCDTEAHDGGEYTQADQPIILEPIGGGGTNFRPPFKWLDENEITPTCLIYYTDGYCHRFPEEPDYPVLWALYGSPRRFPFGETVNITPEEE
jgi:predicted metal-dependent peptidase